MNFLDARDAQHTQDLAPSSAVNNKEERRAYRRGQARILRAHMDERVAAKWRRAHPKEAAAEYEFWATQAAERAVRRAEHEHLR